MSIRLVKIIPVNKYNGYVNRHKYWLVKDPATTEILSIKESATEAIKYVDDEGLVLQPD